MAEDGLGRGDDAARAATMSEGAAPTAPIEELFRGVFDDGMVLVEDAATYLDGPGRDESKRLGRDAALSYASESMRLTTRLMQIASWLLVQRAVREGDMSAREAEQDQYCLREDDLEPVCDRLDDEALPPRLIALARRSDQLAYRIKRLLAMVRDPHSEAVVSPAKLQQEYLRHVFGQ